MATILSASSVEDLATIHPARPDRFADASVHEVFKRLRKEAPIHRMENSEFGTYWSITHYKDIVEIEALPQRYSSELKLGGISVIDKDYIGENDKVDDEEVEIFIAMDPPRHTSRRRGIAPAFTPSEILRQANGIRERTAKRLDSLPRGEVFDWTKEVSIDLTTDMLASLLDFPWDKRHMLPIWSDAFNDLDMLTTGREKRTALVTEMAMAMFELWQQRLNAEQTPDLISMMIHSEGFRDMAPQEFVGNMTLIVVGGNDTTRNTMSGLAEVICRWPDQWEKIVANPDLITNATSEIIRWQTAVAHMRRTVTEDHEFRGHQFKAGEKVVLWYTSANRDEEMFEQGELFLPERENARRHLSFGYGVHRCVGARLAELQVSILIEEMVKRGMRLEAAGPVGREANPFVYSINSTPVRIVAG